MLDGNKIICEFCKSYDSKPYIKTDLVSYSICCKCGLIFQNPVISQNEIDAIYDDNYFEYEIENQDNFYNLMRQSLKDIEFEKFEKDLPNKRILDIGCATGMLLSYLKSKGYESHGVEICKASANYARDYHGLKVYNKPLLETGFKDNYFSIIHFSHLIEHVPNPSEVLKEIYRILSPNGYIILTTPNAEGTFAKKYGENWRAVMPQHLWLFSKSTLSCYIKSIGFEIVKDLSWGSIPIEKKSNKIIKRLADKYVKLFNKGDVMLLLCKK